MEYYSVIKKNEIISFVVTLRDCPAEWSKSDRKWQISYAITYMCNFEKGREAGNKWTYFQKKAVDVENKTYSYQKERGNW